MYARMISFIEKHDFYIMRNMDFENYTPPNTEQ